MTLDSNTERILAMAGGADYKESQFNRVTQAQRQPGSTFKIVTYLLPRSGYSSGSKPIPVNP